MQADSDKWLPMARSALVPSFHTVARNDLIALKRVDCSRNVSPSL
jgi:hypothetical protein